MLWEGNDRGDIIILNMRTRYVNRITVTWNYKIFGPWQGISEMARELLLRYPLLSNRLLFLVLQDNASFETA